MGRHNKPCTQSYYLPESKAFDKTSFYLCILYRSYSAPPIFINSLRVFVLICALVFVLVCALPFDALIISFEFTFEKFLKFIVSDNQNFSQLLQVIHSPNPDFIMAKSTSDPPHHLKNSPKPNGSGEYLEFAIKLFFLTF